MLEMPPAVPSTWQPIGTTSDTRYFMAGGGIVIVYPNPGTIDDGLSAKQNVDLQRELALKAGTRLGYVIVLSALVSQDAEARRAYSDGMSPEWSYGAALVVQNLLSRAIASFFSGRTKPRVPVKVVESIDEGISWLRDHTARESRS